MISLRSGFPAVITAIVLLASGAASGPLSGAAAALPAASPGQDVHLDQNIRKLWQVSDRQAEQSPSPSAVPAPADASPAPSPAQVGEPSAASGSTPDAASPAVTPPGTPPAAAAGPEPVVPSAPARAEPYRLALFRSGEGITIEGHMPSEAEREALVSAARSLLPGLVVTDLTEIAAGVPEGVDWAATGRFLVLQALRLRQGELRVSGTELAVRGEPADRAGLVALNNALAAGALPQGLRLASAELAPARVSPFAWAVSRLGGEVILRGYVPSAEAGQAVRTLAASLFGDATIRDEQVVAAGAPDGFADAVAAALGHLSLIGDGRAELADRALVVSGSAPSDVAAAAARSAIEASVPFGFTVRHAISEPVAPPPPAPAAPPPPADTCSPRIAEVMSQGGIVFQFGRETMRPDSLQRLRRIAEILKECPQVAFVVEGHTDSDGNANQNRDLSERRAAAVVSVLVRQGIAAARLTAEGLGQTRPLVPNDSAANKARNRRIEFRAAR